MKNILRHHAPPSIPIESEENGEDRLLWVRYGPCDRCDGERPFRVEDTDPLDDEDEYIDII